MNIQVDFVIVVVILLIIGNEVSQVKRKLEKIEEILRPSYFEVPSDPLTTAHVDWKFGNLEKHIDWRFANAEIDLKNVQTSLESDIGTIQGDKMEGKLDDILEKLDELSD